jgi:hypothetical protein
VVSTTATWALMVYASFGGMSQLTLHGQFKTEPQCLTAASELPRVAYFWACAWQRSVTPPPLLGLRLRLDGR